MKNAIRWEKYALIVELADRLKNTSSQFGKTALQKMIFLLQEVYNVDLGYKFDLYTYGPFTSELLQDLDLVESIGGVKVLPTALGAGGVKGYQILPGERGEAVKEKAKEFLDKISDSLNNLINNFGHYSAKSLELRSTIVYVAKDMVRSKGTVDQSELVRIVKEIKPKFSSDDIQKAVTEMMEYIDFGKAAG